MYFVFLFSLVLFLFKNAFSVYFFSDDFFFLKISRINNLGEFINFFSPIKNYFYRPLSTEFFYSIIHLLKENIFLSHLIVFIIFFIGLLYLYKTVSLVFKDSLFSYLITFLYAINFTHVFQLYFFGTFQEVALFTFVVLSFYHFLKKKYLPSIFFFILALLSKESALFYLLFLLIYSSLTKRLNKKIVPYLIISIIFIFIFKNGLANTSSLDEYRFQWNIKQALNNSIWYFLWGLGVPNFTSLYFVSLLKPPIAEFYKMFKNFPEIKTYYQTLFIYYFLIGLSLVIYFLKAKNLIKTIKTLGLTIIFSVLGFFVFLGPILFIEHRWMVRLTLPLIFSTLIQTAIIIILIRSKKLLRIFGFTLIIIYFYLQVLAIPIHESSSTFLLESRFTKNAKEYFEENKNKIIKNNYLYFKDPKIGLPNPWGGSEKLKITLGNQNFIDHYFPNFNLKVIYNFEDKKIPNRSFVVNSVDILLPNKK